MAGRGAWIGIAGGLLALAAQGVAAAPAAAPSDPLGGPAVIAGHQIISGAIHYPRVPRALWRDRLKKARAMGLNTVETYAFWNVHEPVEGQFDFTGQNDIAAFVREAAEEGLQVIVRPGPYVCAEWEWGGFPPWLNKDPTMQVRSSNPRFMAATERYLTALAAQLAPLQADRGGPIIGVQVENEYGSYGADHAYMRAMRDAYVRAGFAPSLLFTADGPDVLANGALPDLPVGLNFGAGDGRRAISIFQKFRPGAPLFVSEYWAGWFDHWGAPHATRDAAKQAAELKAMLAAGASVNLYMFTGGTNFGWMAGANNAGANADHTTSAKINYEPDVTSYDYDSPLSEAGEPTPKYFAFRDAILSATNQTPPPLPAPAKRIAIAPVRLAHGTSLWSALPAPIRRDDAPTMEDVGQSYGYILYRTTIDRATGGPVDLVLPEVRAYAAIFVDGVLQGAVDRRLKQTTLPLTSVRKGATLDILVENTGRVNYGPGLPGERAGLIGNPQLGGQALRGWDVFPLPMAQPDAAATGPDCTGPCFYRASFDLAEPADSFLDTARLGKGAVWVNGHALGRFWNVGPQRTLYLPAPLLRAGRNDVVVFDLYGRPGATVAGLAHPILDATPREDAASKRSR